MIGMIQEEQPFWSHAKTNQIAVFLGGAHYEIQTVATNFHQTADQAMTARTGNAFRAFRLNEGRECLVPVVCSLYLQNFPRPVRVEKILTFRCDLQQRPFGRSAAVAASSESVDQMPQAASMKPPLDLQLRRRGSELVGRRRAVSFRTKSIL